MPDRLKVGRLTLDQVILVQIQVRQQDWTPNDRKRQNCRILLAKYHFILESLGPYSCYSKSFEDEPKFWIEKDGGYNLKLDDSIKDLVKTIGVDFKNAISALDANENLQSNQ